MPRFACCIDDETGEYIDWPGWLAFELTGNSHEGCPGYNVGFNLEFKDGEYKSASSNPWRVRLTPIDCSGSTVKFWLQWQVETDNGTCVGEYVYPSTSCSTIHLVFDGYWNSTQVCCHQSNHIEISAGPLFAEGAPIPTPPPCFCACDDPNECCPDEPPIGGSGEAGCQAAAAWADIDRNAPSPPVASCASMRFATGEVMVHAVDLKTEGFGVPWGHTRSFVSRQSFNTMLGNGYNWNVQQWPYLAKLFSESDGPDTSVTTLVVQGKPSEALWFDKDGSNWVSRFNVKQSLIHDAGSQVYRLYELDGSVTEFDDYSGMFRRQTAPGGQMVEVVEMASNSFNFTKVERSYQSGGETTTEQYLYEYDSSLGDAVLTKLTLRRRVNAGAWTNVSKVEYTYYGYSDDYGGWEDLESVTTYSWGGSSWTDTGTTMYRYYLDDASSSSSSSSSSSGAPLVIGGNPSRLLKYVVNPEAYNRLKNDPSVTDPLTASDAIVSQYADYYFEYDSERRVTLESIQGGSRTYTFSYSESSHADGYNSWKSKTIESLPDGNQNIIYANYAGQTMLSVFKSGADEWCRFFKYDDAKVILQANPSAISGYDEQYADLLHEQNGNYEYLKDTEGLIGSWSYHEPTGWITSSAVQKGESGTPNTLREFEYVGCSPSTSSSSSSSSGSPSSPPPTYFRSKETVYPDDPEPCPGDSSSSSSSGPTRTIVTSYSYTWYDGTCQVKEKTTTLPAVPTNQNGSGSSDSSKMYFDEHGYNTWQMDERGFITGTRFDIPTGAVTQLIQDVDTSVETDAPSGWVTPSGGGLNLVTDLEHDGRGRITQSLGPSHEIDIDGTATTIRRAMWFVYDNNDSENITRVGRGYATGTSPSYSYTLINPVSISISDKNNQILAEIQATRASTSGKLSPSDTFAQTSYTRWATRQYTDCCVLASQRAYHTIPSSGSGSAGTNYDETSYGYDLMKRRNRTETPGGTITWVVYEARGLVEEIWMGTNDTGATSSDPSGGGAAGNNMVIITANEYDDGGDGGDGNLTEQTQHVDAATTRTTGYVYDYRRRRTDIDGEIDFYQQQCFDNLNRVIRTDRRDTTSVGNLIARSTNHYDDRGRVYQSVRYGVDPSTGVVGNSLTDNSWFDGSGNLIKSLPAGSELFTKATFDSLGRTTTTYRGYDLDETTYADAGSVTGDTILEQTETDYDDVSNVIQRTTRQRYHDAPASQTGELKNPSTTPKARVTYVATYPDAIGREQATANYGTNGGSSLSRSSTIPDRSDDILVSSMSFDDAGNESTSTDPAGMVVKMEYDDLGRETKKISNYIQSSSSSSSSSAECGPSDDTNVAIETAYNADGNVSSVTAVNAVTGNQTTQFVYGTTLSDSDVASSLLKRKEIYPDSNDSSDVVLFAYNRQQQETSLTDQNGTVHDYDFDLLGRRTQDRVTTLGTGVDGAVRRIATTFEVRGMRENITSYDNATVGSGSVVNDVQFAYNDFAQLTHDYQSHSGAVNTASSPKVQYGFANGAANTIRSTSLTYPDGRVLTYDYGTTDGINDASSRIESLVDDDVSSTHLVDYSYLGERTFVIADLTEPDVKWTLADLTGTNDPGTGDIYSGLDRFGRIKDNRWYDYGSAVDVDRIKYGYDRASNRIWRQNTVADALGKHFDELYGNDDIHRLKDLERGTLNANKDAVTNKSFAECWSLDPTGNWKKYLEDTDGDDTWDLDQNRTANKVNEITDVTETSGPSWVTPAYSNAGNMTTVPQAADPTKSYTVTYDAWNRLVTIVDDVTSNNVSEYQYDGAQRRTIQKLYSGGSLDETRHLYYTEPSRWQIIEERVDSGTRAIQQLVWGLRYIDEIAMRDRSTSGNGALDERLYSLLDATWSVTSLINSAAGVQQRVSYHAYGRPIFLNTTFGASNNTHEWTTLYSGYRFDTITAFYAVRNRVLNYSLGRWVQRDPLGLSAGISLYEYVSSSPLNDVDPFGLICFGVESDAFLCACLILEIADVFLPFELVEKLDCVCAAGKIVKQFCHHGNIAEIGSQVLLATIDCLSNQIGCALFLVPGMAIGGSFGLYPGMAGAVIGCLGGGIVVDLVAVALQNVVLAGTPLPKKEWDACCRIGTKLGIL